MKASDTVKFFVGCFILYFAWQLHQAGWFEAVADLFSRNSLRYNGFGGVADVLIGVIPVAVDAVCVVGSVAIAFYGFLWKLVSPVIVKLLMLLDAKVEERYGIDLYDFDGEEKE